MKKLFALLLALAMVFGMVACGQKEPEAAPEAAPAPEPEPVKKPCATRKRTSKKKEAPEPEAEAAPVPEPEPAPEPASMPIVDDVDLDRRRVCAVRVAYVHCARVFGRGFGVRVVGNVHEQLLYGYVELVLRAKRAQAAVELGVDELVHALQFGGARGNRERCGDFRWHANLQS